MDLQSLDVGDREQIERLSLAVRDKHTVHDDPTPDAFRRPPAKAADQIADIERRRALELVSGNEVRPGNRRMRPALVKPRPREARALTLDRDID